VQGQDGSTAYVTTAGSSARPLAEYTEVGRAFFGSITVQEVAYSYCDRS
jgi:hypothetical protein